MSFENGSGDDGALAAAANDGRRCVPHISIASKRAPDVMNKTGKLQPHAVGVKCQQCSRLQYGVPLRFQDAKADIAQFERVTVLNLNLNLQPHPRLRMA